MDNKSIKMIVSKDHQNIFEKNEDLNDLNRSLKMYKAAIDSIAIVAETDVNGIITSVNKNFIDISKYSKEELIGQDHRIVNSGFHDKTFFKNLWNTIQSGYIWTGEIKNKAKDGSYYWVDTTIYPILDKNDKPTGFIAIRLDITEKKENLENLKTAKEKAVAADLAKSNFLSTISHEIRTPLNGIIGMTNLLLDTNLNNEQRSFTNTIMQSGKLLLTLINEILDFSKIDSGKLELEENPFDLKNFLLDLTKPFVYLSQQKNIKFIVDIPDMQKQVIGDSGRIGQIVTNLLSNAFKFTESGQIKFLVTVKNKKNEIFIIFKIIDTGIGMSNIALENLFTEFYQAEASTQRKYGGTGLGLSICKKLILLMNGTIHVDSKLGVGTEFTVKLSLKESDKIRNTGDQNTSHLSNEFSIYAPLSGRILVAEDNHTNQFIIARMLEKFNLKFQLVANGLEALDAISKSNFDLVLMDCQMPEMDGYQATKAIRNLPNEIKKIPIIALTANAIKGDRNKCIDFGMNDYLTKPVFMPDLYKILKFYLSMNEKQNHNFKFVELEKISQIIELENEEHPNLLVEIIDLFFKTSPPYIQSINVSLNTVNITQASASAHALKSSALNLGASQLGNICQQIENLNSESTSNLNVLKEYILKLNEIYTNTCKELSDLKKQRTNLIVSKKVN